ncbi:hypothetical protein MY11210_003897 [Beauveria gryllotalpidicola]
MFISEQYDYSSFISNLLSRVFGMVSDGLIIRRDGTATNNHVYIIHLAEPTKTEMRSKDASLKPFTYPIPGGTSRLVIRIPRANNNMEDDIRIRNEVACLALARNAVADIDHSLFPRVFSWDDVAISSSSCSSRSSFSYILEEFKTGEALSWDDLRTLDHESLSFVCQQLARVTKALQAYKLPSGITGYGGVTFNDTGELSSTKCIFRTGGPYGTYREYLKATVLWQLAESEKIDILGGWRDIPDAPGLRERIDDFVANGLDALLSKIPEYRPTLVHGDLTLPNILFDRSTSSLKAIIDFDFGHIGSPITEYFYSFPEFYGILLGVAEPENGVRDMVLNGYTGAITPNRVTGKMWEEALAVQGAQRPSTIEGADIMANVWWFGMELLQFHWMIPRLYEQMSADDKEGSRSKSARHLQTYLEHWGY